MLLNLNVCLLLQVKMDDFLGRVQGDITQNYSNLNVILAPSDNDGSSQSFLYVIKTSAFDLSHSDQRPEVGFISPFQVIVTAKQCQYPNTADFILNFELITFHGKSLLKKTCYPGLALVT